MFIFCVIVEMSRLFRDIPLNNGRNQYCDINKLDIKLMVNFIDFPYVASKIMIIRVHS